jgi:hypothetical protein
VVSRRRQIENGSVFSVRQAEIDHGGDVEQAVEQPRQNGAEQCHFKRGWVCEVSDQEDWQHPAQRL